MPGINPLCPAPPLPSTLTESGLATRPLGTGGADLVSLDVEARLARPRLHQLHPPVAGPHRQHPA